MKASRRLHDLGQSIWLENVARRCGKGALAVCEGWNDDKTPAAEPQHKGALSFDHHDALKNGMSRDEHAA
jgi:hypothetical protein